MTRAPSRVLVAISAVVLLCLAAPSQASDKKDPGQVTVIQAVPGARVDVEIDGESSGIPGLVSFSLLGAAASLLFVLVTRRRGATLRLSG